MAVAQGATDRQSRVAAKIDNVQAAVLLYKFHEQRHNEERLVKQAAEQWGERPTRYNTSLPQGESRTDGASVKKIEQSAFRVRNGGKLVTWFESAEAG